MTQPTPDASARDRLIATARHLFCRRSYASVGVQELCEQADVRRGSFYYHFESKQDLALAAIDADWEAQKAEIYEPAFAADVPPLEAFDRYQELLYESHRRHASGGQYGGCLIVSLAQETALTDPPIRDRATAHLTEAGTYFESALGRAIDEGLVPPCDTKDFARRVLGYVEGMLTHARIRQDPDRIARMKYELWKLAAPVG